MTQESIRLTTPADILGAIPAALGYVPENSVVVLGLAVNPAGQHDIACIARLDAADVLAAAAAGPTARKLAGTLAPQRSAAGSPVTDVIVVAITDTDHTETALRWIDLLRTELARRAIAVDRALHAFSLTAGTMFTDLDTGADGVVPDTTTTPVATLAATQGRVTGANRDELAARFAAREPIPEEVGLDAARSLGEKFLPATFDDLAAAIASNEIPSENLTARVGLALATGRLEVRDAFLALGFAGYPAAANTFTIIANRLPGVARAHAMTVATFFWYCTGDGTAVNIALTAVRAAAYRAGIATPTLAALLDEGIGEGAPPEGLRAIAAGFTPAYIAEHIGTVTSYT